jgi:hypothetical protein
MPSSAPETGRFFISRRNVETAGLLVVYLTQEYSAPAEIHKELSMKRVALLVVCIAVLASGMAFAKGAGGLTAIGVYGNYGFTGGGGGIGLSLKFGSFPVIGIKYSLTQNGYLGATVDWYVVDSAGLIDNMTFFVAAGAYAGFGFGPGNNFDFGLRIPIGLQLWLLKKLEIYLAAIPAIPVFPSIGLGFGAELGLRVHF